MGAWGTGIYENDGAGDLVAYVLQDGVGLTRVEEALDRVLATGDEYLESPEGSEGLAAADIVSRLGRPLDRAEDVPAELAAWLTENNTPAGAELLAKARATVERVAREPSELVELWSESGSLNEDWKATVEALSKRLEQNGS